MKVCHVFLDFETKVEVYAEIYKKLDDLCGVHDTIYGTWILSGENIEYDFQLWDQTFILPDVTYYFHGNEWEYPNRFLVVKELCIGNYDESNARSCWKC